MADVPWWVAMLRPEITGNDGWSMIISYVCDGNLQQIHYVEENATEYEIAREYALKLIRNR